MKRFAALLGLLTLFLALPAYARRPLVNDEAGALPPDKEQALEDKLLVFVTKYGTEFRVLIPRDLKGESLEALAERTFREWQIGEGRETGLLLVALPDGRAHLQTPPGADTWAPVSSNQAAKHIRETFTPVFEKDGLMEALVATADSIENQDLVPLFGPGYHRRPRGKPVDQYKVQYWSGSFALLLGILGATFFRLRRAQPRPAPGVDVAAEESFLLHGLNRVLRTRLPAPAWFDVLVLTAVALTLRTIWLSVPDGLDGFIFDESYYVRHAHVLLGLPVEMREGDWWLSGLDPNAEHPPLGKLLIALSIYLLGDDGWGWRLPSVIAGTASIPVLYGIVRQMRGGHALALTAAYLLTCDNLSFVHGRMATLDMFFVFFMLCALYAYVSGLVEVAAVALALSTLCKISGLFGWAALVGFEIARAVSARWNALPAPLPWKRVLWLSAGYATCFLVFLGALDAKWGLYVDPIEHVSWILDYGKSLASTTVTGTESEPWQWLLNQVEMTYMRQARVEVTGDTRVEIAVIDIRGAMNPLIVWVAPLTVGYATWRGLRRYDELALLAAAMFFATYAPYWPMRHLAHRVCYIHYFLASVPAVAMANAWFARVVTPRWVRGLYLAGVTAMAIYWFPFREVPSELPPPSGDAPIQSS